MVPPDIFVLHKELQEFLCEQEFRDFYSIAGIKGRYIYKDICVDKELFSLSYAVKRHIRVPCLQQCISLFSYQEECFPRFPQRLIPPLTSLRFARGGCWLVRTLLSRNEIKSKASYCFSSESSLNFCNNSLSERVTVSVMPFSL